LVSLLSQPPVFASFRLGALALHDPPSFPTRRSSDLKTANVVMSVAFGEPSLAVDTHVERVSKRLGICRIKDNVRQVEDRLCSIIPRERWTKSHHQLIFFGRYHSVSRKPKCEVCPLLDDCREGQKRLRAGLVKVDGA